MHSLFAFLDWRILAFTIGVSLLTGILFGLFPALQIANPNLAATLKEAGTRSSTGRHQNLTRKTLVAVEMALALVLLTSAALLIRTFIGLSSAQSGIDSHHVLTMLTSLTGSRYQTTEAVDLFTRQALQRIQSIPGVESASTSVVLPTTNQIDLDLDVPDKALPAGQDHSGDEQWRSITAEYFNVYRIPLHRGRFFNDQDTTLSAPVVIVNASFVRKYFAKDSPLGKVIEIGKGIGPEFVDPAREIVGVVGDVREKGLTEKDIPVMYVPQAQQPQGVTKLISSLIPLAWSIRSQLDEKSLTAAVTKEIQAIDGQMPVAQVRPMDRILKDRLSSQNFNMLLLSIFAGSALLLAAIGIYGLMSYVVQQQTQELGVRIALGAGKSNVVRLVMQQGMTPALFGVGAGLVVAFALTRLMESLLYEVKPADPISFVAVAAILTIVAILAILIPARRAMSIDPLDALRSE